MTTGHWTQHWAMWQPYWTVSSWYTQPVTGAYTQLHLMDAFILCLYLADTQAVMAVRLQEGYGGSF